MSIRNATPEDHDAIEYLLGQLDYPGTEGFRHYKMIQCDRIEVHCHQRRTEVHCHQRRTDAHRFYERQGYTDSSKYLIKTL